MKWWHRWRLRVWQFRYFKARGKIASIDDHHSEEYMDAVCERETAASACEYHHARSNAALQKDSKEK